MKNQKFKDHIYWGATAMAVVAASVALAFFFIKFKEVKSFFRFLFGILMPVIYGAVLAYLMLPIYNRSSRLVVGFLKGRIKNEKTVTGISKATGTFVTLAMIVIIVTGLFSMLLPEMDRSIRYLQSTLEGNINNLTVWLRQLMAANPRLEAYVIPVYEQVADMFQTWLSKDLLPNVTVLIGGLSSGLMSIVVVLKNILIGLIVMIYLLNIKDTLTAQCKKIVYSILQIRLANRLVAEVRLTHKIFGGFITGKLLDSLIIGIICFFCLKFMEMPYILLISVIVGVTNIIPFFGPFIGAVPSAFLILLVDPLKCLYFLIFILILQQFDGNILGPKILGDSTGLPSFWVLFSILLFGGLFGFVGMIIAVPTTAVAYNLISEAVSKSLEKRSLSSVTQDYKTLEYIDEEKKTFVE